MNDETTEHRDLELGAALHALRTPEHRPEFHRELRRLIAAEQGAARRRTRLRFVVRLVAVAAVAAIVAVAIGLPRTHRAPGIGPEPASAAVVKAHLRSALTELRTLTGVLVASGPAQHGTERWRFALDAAGDVRLEGPGAGDVLTYDAAAGLVRSAQHSASLGGSALFYAERRGVAPGPPDLGPPTWILPDEVAAYVRAALAAKDPAVHAVTYLGRPAWQLDIATIPNAVAPELSGDELEVTVDQATGFPVRVLERKRGELLREVRMEQLQVDADLSAGTFALRFPAGADVMRTDEGFRRVELGDVAAAVGYAPLVPAFVPDGYRLAQVAVADASASTGKEGTNPPSRMVVSLSYRRGLDQFLVTTRLRGGAAWDDPLASPEGFVDHPETVRVASGALAGTEAQVVLSPHATPHVWALTRDLVVTVGGDLSRAELERVASSLRTSTP
jgi:hypothetical protein